MLSDRSDTLGLLITTVPVTWSLILVGETVVWMTYWVRVSEVVQVWLSVSDELRVKVPLVPRAQTETM
jgi:hypothetical protein